MPATPQDYEAIKAAQAKAQASNQAASYLTSNAQTLSSNIMNAVYEDRRARGSDPIAESRGRATGAIIGDSAAMRGRLSGIDPSSVNNLAEMQRANTISQLSSLDASEARMNQSYADIIGGGAQQLMAAATMKKAEADQANQEASNLMEMLQYKLAEERERFNQRVEMAKLAQSGAQAKGFSGLFNTEGMDPQKAALIEAMQRAANNPKDLMDIYEFTQGGANRNVELRGPAATEMTSLKNLYDAAQLANSLHSNKFTGFGDSVGGWFRSMGIGGNPLANETEYRDAVADIRTQIRAAVSGAAISEKEGKELEGLLPGLFKGDKAAKEAFASVMNRALRKGQNILDVEGYGDVDIRDYFGISGGGLNQSKMSALDKLYGY